MGQVTEPRTYKGRPAVIRRAIHVDYLDGVLPSSEILVLDDDAPPGGTTRWYYEGEPPVTLAVSAPEATRGVPPSDPPTPPQQRGTGARGRPRGEAG